MAFHPSENQLYYLMPKHSQAEGMCLGLEDSNEGRPLQLQKMASNPNKAKGQKFGFETNGPTCWISLPGYDNRYLNVAQASGQNKAQIVSFRKENVHHEQFQLLYAGEGYYRIMCYHSKKFFDVWGLNTAAGSPVYQGDLTGTDNQLFKLVAVANNKVGKDATSFIEANETVRNLALPVIAQIPEAGAGLAFVVGIFWEKKDKLADLWEQMKAYVDARLEAYFKKAKLDQLSNTLKGTMDKLGGIVNSDIERGPRLVAAIDAMVENRASFDSEMLDTLPYFVALQTIIIGARHTLYHDFDTLFPGNPKGKAEAEKNLTDDINDYTTAIENQRSYILELRSDKVQCNAQLDELLYTSRFWKYMLPGAPFYKPELKQLAVSFNGAGSAKTTFDRGQGKISEIRTYYYNPYGDMRGPFQAIEVFYDGVSQGIKGGDPAPSKYPPAHVIKLVEDEWICSVHGFYGFKEFMCTTTKGQITRNNELFVPGTNSVHYFCADLPDSMNARLVGISGKISKQVLSEITFHWDFIQ
ncbi:MAG: RICIN domain-containing protein [Bacteroidota bacterium]